jgi:hypothetical protein
MPDTVRVHTGIGGHHDYPGADFSVSREGLLTVTRRYADGRLGEDTVAVFAPGHYEYAEKVPEDTAPPEIGFHIA